MSRELPKSARPDADLEKNFAPIRCGEGGRGRGNPPGRRNFERTFRFGQINRATDDVRRAAALARQRAQPHPRLGISAAPKTLDGSRGASLVQIPAMGL
jgi:hypothetical protein